MLSRLIYKHPQFNRSAGTHGGMAYHAGGLRDITHFCREAPFPVLAKARGAGRI